MTSEERFTKYQTIAKLRGNELVFVAKDNTKHLFPGATENWFMRIEKWETDKNIEVGMYSARNGSLGMKGDYCMSTFPTTFDWINDNCRLVEIKLNT